MFREIKVFLEKVLQIKKAHDRTGEIWVCDFNGYPESGEVIQSLRALRYVNHKLCNIYVHIVKVNNCHRFNEIHHWKEINCWERDKTKFRLK